MAHIIVVGNEKGGSGKSTTSMHIATALARMGKRVGVLDLDLRQKSLAAYVEKREETCTQENLRLAGPRYQPLPPPEKDKLKEGEHPLDQRLSAAVALLEPECDFIIADCPGSHTRLSQMAHALADTLVTPINDSFVDFDLLAKTEENGTKIKGPSVYSEMVWAARQMRAQAGKQPMDWVVLRNRVGAQNMLNKKKMGDALNNLARRIGFRVIPGLSERVIFRELFPRGLTLLDLRDVGITQLNISNIAARQELRDLMKALNLPNVEVNF